MIRLVVLVSLLLPITAEASLCDLEPASLAVPVNCALIVYNRANTELPRVVVVRDGAPLAIEPMTTRTTRVTLAVDYSDTCPASGDEYPIVHETRAMEYDIVELALPGVEVNDVLEIEGLGPHGKIIEAAAQCYSNLDFGPSCNGTGAIDCAAHGRVDDEGEGEGGGGCNVGGASGGLALAIAALLARRRGRRNITRATSST